MPNIPHIPSLYICYAICKAKNIPVILRMRMPNIEGLPQCEYLTTDIEKLGWDFGIKYKENKMHYESFKAKDILLPKILDSYFENYSDRSFGKKSVTIEQESNNLFKKAKIYIKRGSLYLTGGRKMLLLYKMAYIVKTRLRSNKILKYYESLVKEPDLGKKYIYFPMHFQPEATTLPQAGFYSAQLLIAETLASSIPEDVILYVKEHPAYWLMKDRNECVSEARTKWFYDRMNSLPNVVLLPHDYSSFELLDNCQCVATANGTVGWEALFKGKSVLAFGNYFYNYFDKVYKIKNAEECENAIRTILTEGKHTFNKKDLRVFLKTMEDVILISGKGDSEIPGHEWALFSEEEFFVNQAKIIGNYAKKVVDNDHKPDTEKTYA